MEFVEYLKVHPELIASFILFVLAIITLIVKRKPKSLDEFVSILSDVCSSVSSKMVSVEVPGHGIEKKEKVISLCLAEMSTRLHRVLTDKESAIVRLNVSDQIESVMDAPHRKEA